MPITVDWATRIISVPQDYLTPLGGSVYELDIPAFKISLRDISDSEEGIVHPVMIRHNTTVTLGGVEYARLVEIINGYTITFENGTYIVNLKAANSNILDVTNLNGVSVRSNNSAGLIGVSEMGSSIADLVATIATMDLRSAIIEAILRNKMITDPVTGIMTIYDTDGTTPLLTAQMYEGTVTAQKYRGQGAERRERLS